MNFLSKYPLFFFLIPLYPFLSLFNHNFADIETKNVWRAFLTILMTATILSLLNIILKKFVPRFKFFLFAFFFLILFFTYGIQYEIAEKLYYKGFWPLKNIHRYLLLFNVLISFVLVFYLQKRKCSEQNFYQKINVFFSILLLFNVFQILFKSLRIPHHDKDKSDMDVIFSSQVQRPDIIYIILDGYASDQVLKDFYDFDNSDFKNKLAAFGFKNYTDVITYYYGTSASLNAILNLNFTDDATPDKYNLKNNLLFQYLKKLGYTIKNIESGYSVTSKFSDAQKIQTGGLNEFERTYLRLTIVRFDELFGGMAYQRIKEQLKTLNNIEKHLTDSPDFIFTHIVCPHPPFVFDKHGNRKRKFINQDNFWEPASDFVEQTQAINNFLMPVLEKLSSLENTIIIIQSDHGPWLSSKNLQDVLQVRESVLTSVKWNKKIPADTLRHTINTFRLLIKTEIDSSMPLLNHREKSLDAFKNYVELTSVLNKHDE